MSARSSCAGDEALEGPGHRLRGAEYAPIDEDDLQGVYALKHFKTGIFGWSSFLVRTLVVSRGSLILELACSLETDRAKLLEDARALLDAAWRTKRQPTSGQ